eukprot:jgi/Psemu1/262557/estExt_Genewise1Plus.C_7950027
MTISYCTRIALPCTALHCIALHCTRDGSLDDPFQSIGRGNDTKRMGRNGTERKNLPRIRSNQIKRRPSLYKTLNTKNMNNGEQTNIPRQGTRQGHTHDS